MIKRSQVRQFANMILLILVVLVCLLAIIWWYLRYYYYCMTMWDIPEPGIPIPLIGHLLEVKNPSNAYFDLHRILTTKGNYKSIRGIIGFYPGIFTADPFLLEHLMTHTSAINKSSLYRFIQQWLGTGLLTSGGDKWRKRRKLVTPSYHFKILEQFIDVFDKNGHILVKQLGNEVGSETTNIYPYISLCALDTICETAMGTPIHAQENSDSEYVHAIKEISLLIIDRAVSLFKQADILYALSRNYQREKKAIKLLHKYTSSVINTRRIELLKNMNTNSTTEDEIGQKKKIPFLDLLLKSSLDGAQLTDDDIREEVDTFMFEGHDTVTSAISFCLYCLSNNTDIQEEVIAEQRSIYLDNPHQPTTLLEINQMNYLEMVIKEALRLYPSVPVFGRVINKDIKYGEYIFKKGMELGIMVYTMHRNPEIYPDPDRFDPLRFTPEMQSKRHPFAYLPFSAGHRNCVGQKFAMLEMKSTISKVLRNYVISSAENNKLRLKSGLVLVSETGVPVKLQKRKW